MNRRDIFFRGRAWVNQLIVDILNLTDVNATPTQIRNPTYAPRDSGIVLPAVSSLYPPLPTVHTRSHRTQTASNSPSRPASRRASRPSTIYRRRGDCLGAGGASVSAGGASSTVLQHPRSESASHIAASYGGSVYTVPSQMSYLPAADTSLHYNTAATSMNECSE